MHDPVFFGAGTLWFMPFVTIIFFYYAIHFGIAAFSFLIFGALLCQGRCIDFSVNLHMPGTSNDYIIRIAPIYLYSRSIFSHFFESFDKQYCVTSLPACCDASFGIPLVKPFDVSHCCSSMIWPTLAHFLFGILCTNVLHMLLSQLMVMPGHTFHIVWGS